MPYIALKRLKVGETDDLIGRDLVGMKVVEERWDGSIVQEPEYRDVFAPIYREPGDIVPEAEEWAFDDRERLIQTGFLRFTNEADAPPAPKPAPRIKQKAAPSA